MLHRLPFGALLLLLSSSIVSLAACAGGSNADDDGDPVDAREIDTASPDAPSPDAANVDASTPDASSPDAATDAATDATVDAGIDAMPLPGEVCQMPETITITGGLGNATVSGTTVGYANNYNAPATCADYLQDGPDHVYEVSVPAGARLTAAVTPGSGYDAGIYLVASPAATCDVNPLVCLDGDDSGSSTSVNSVRYDNTTNAAVSVFVVLDGTSTVGGTYTLAVTVATIPPPPVGDVCTTAEAITLTNGYGTATGSTTTANNFNNDYVPPAACAPGDGNDHVHSVTVPAGEQLVATLVPSSGFDATLYFIAGPAASCAATPIVCLDGVDDGASGSVERLAYTNSTGNPVDVFMVVDGYENSDEGSYTLIVGPPPGDTCQRAEAVTLTSGMATVTGSTRTGAGYTANYAPPSACTSTYTQNGNDRVHLVAVPTGTTLTATLTPTGFDAGIYLVAGPAASCDASPIACLAGLDMGGSGAAETVTYMNSTGSTVEVMVVVDSYSSTAQGDYSLALMVQ